MVISKKGDLMTNVIIGVVILVISIVIILFIWGRISANALITDEACIQSIVLRSTFNIGGIEIGKDSIPLNCRTKKFCLTSTNGKCEGQVTSSKKSPVEKINIDIEEAKVQTMDAISDALYNCNYLLGGGLLDFLPSSWITTEKYCLICSRIFLEDEVKEAVNGEITFGELYAHMNNKIDDEGRSHLSYVYPEFVNWQDSIEIFNVLKSNIVFDDVGEDNKGLAQELSNMDFENWKMNFPLNNLDQGIAVIAAVTDFGTFPTWEAYFFGGTTEGAVFTGTGQGSIPFPGPVGVGFGAVRINTGEGDQEILTTTASGLMFNYDYPSGDYQYSSPSIFPFTDESINSLGCDSFENSP